MIIVLLELELIPIEHNSLNKASLRNAESQYYENEISVEMQEIFDISKLNGSIAKFSFGVTITKGNRR